MRLNAHIAAMTRPITDPTADTASGPAPKKPRRIHPAPRRDDPPITVFCRPKANTDPETGARTGPNCLTAMHKHTAFVRPLMTPSTAQNASTRSLHTLVVTLKHRDRVRGVGATFHDARRCVVVAQCRARLDMHRPPMTPTLTPHGAGKRRQ